MNGSHQPSLSRSVSGASSSGSRTRPEPQGPLALFALVVDRIEFRETPPGVGPTTLQWHTEAWHSMSPPMPAGGTRGLKWLTTVVAAVPSTVFPRGVVGDALTPLQRVIDRLTSVHLVLRSSTRRTLGASFAPLHLMESAGGESLRPFDIPLYSPNTSHVVAVVSASIAWQSRWLCNADMESHSFVTGPVTTAVVVTPRKDLQASFIHQWVQRQRQPPRPLMMTTRNTDAEKALAPQRPSNPSDGVSLGPLAAESVRPCVSPAFPSVEFRSDASPKNSLQKALRAMVSRARKLRDTSSPDDRNYSQIATAVEELSLLISTL